MDSIADVTIAAATAMPRFEDGFINLQEVLRQLAESVVNEIMSAEADQLCGATGNSRNGYRERRLVTCVGTLTLRIPKLRVGSFFPDDVIERYQRVDRAIVAAVSEMYATGTSTRKVQRVAAAMGVERLSKDQVSAICERLDSEVEELVTRPFGACRTAGVACWASRWWTQSPTTRGWRSSAGSAPAASPASSSSHPTRTRG